MSDRAFAVLAAIRVSLPSAFRVMFVVPTALADDRLDTADRDWLINELSHFYHNDRWRGVMRRRQKNRRVN